MDRLFQLPALLMPNSGLERLTPVLERGRSEVFRPFWSELLSILQSLARSSAAGAHEVLLEDGQVVVGAPGELCGSEQQLLQRAIEILIPWRKGPFRLFGQEIDAEWRSDMKWDRLSSVLTQVRGQRVFDVGCNNGYYLFRMLAEEPEFLLGCDPSDRCTLAFHLVRNFLKADNIHFLPTGIEEVDCFPEFFDLVLCLGVIYHRRDPYTAIQTLKKAIRPGGRLLLESQVVPGDGFYAFCPPGRYAKAPNVYMVPTVDCLVGWLKRAGFVDLEVVSVASVSPDEQRKTALAPWESLDDFVSPDNDQLTVEGHPFPLRAAVLARKPVPANSKKRRDSDA